MYKFLKTFSGIKNIMMSKFNIPAKKWPKDLVVTNLIYNFAPDMNKSYATYFYFFYFAEHCKAGSCV